MREGTQRKGDGKEELFGLDAPGSTVTREICKASLVMGYVSHSSPNFGITVPVAPQDAYTFGVHLKATKWDEFHGDRHIRTMEVQADSFSGSHLGVEPRTILYEPFEIALFHLPMNAIQDFCRQHDLPVVDSLNFRPGDSFVDPVIAHLARATLPILDNPKDVNGLLADYVNLALIAHLTNRYAGSQQSIRLKKGGLSPWQLRIAKELIEARIDGSLSMSELASACGLSVSHLSRGFSQSTGVPPHRWLLQRRLDKAKDHMLRTDLPLSEIALMCGFSDQGHMTRVFSSAFKTSPGLWRRRNK